MQGKAIEYNFDAIVGPTHNYAGLSVGNVASMQHKDNVSSPRKAALEGLEKMKLLMDKGYFQAVLPPPARPDVDFLKKCGFTGGGDEDILQSAWQFSPALVSACYSASGMWSANSAIISPSADTKDKKVHLTPANLHSLLHRSLETTQIANFLQKIFADPTFFTHHPPLPSVPCFADEGAANHMRLCATYGSAGVEVFVYGRTGFFSQNNTKNFYPRQTKEAFQITGRRHLLSNHKTILVAQNPEAIDAGVFHNDVISTSDRNVLFYHEKSFVDTTDTVKQIQQKLHPVPLLPIKVVQKDISLPLAVSSYLFNSQLLKLPNTKGEENGGGDGDTKCLLLAPMECKENDKVSSFLQSLVSSGSPIKQVCYVPVRQSMKNGGGPACLRLRVVLTEKQAQHFHQGVVLTNSLYKAIKTWIKKHYRDLLKPKDLLDPHLIKESQTALDELSSILQLPNIYPFQN